MTDPLARLADDLGEVADRLADHSAPDADLAEAMASAISTAAPRQTGTLAGSITATQDGVDLAAPYAGVIDAGWPARNIAAAGYIDAGLDGLDLAQPYVDHAADALDHLRPVYT